MYPLCIKVLIKLNSTIDQNKRTFKASNKLVSSSIGIKGFVPLKSVNCFAVKTNGSPLMYMDNVKAEN